MYDPVVVAQFLALAPSVEDAERREGMAPPASPGHPREVTPSVDLLDDSRVALFAAPVLGIACRTAGASAGVVFAYSQSDDTLAPIVSTGLDRPAVVSLHMLRGERLSGWVAAGRRSQRDSDARLDFRGVETPLRGALSVPILTGETLVGVMTLYGPTPGCFASVSLDTIEALGAAIGEAQFRYPEHRPAWMRTKAS